MPNIWWMIPIHWIILIPTKRQTFFLLGVVDNGNWMYTFFSLINLVGLLTLGSLVANGDRDFCAENEEWNEKSWTYLITPIRYQTILYSVHTVNLDAVPLLSPTFPEATVIGQSISAPTPIHFICVSVNWNHSSHPTGSGALGTVNLEQCCWWIIQSNAST